MSIPPLSVNAEQLTQTAGQFLSPPKTFLSYSNKFVPLFKSVQNGPQFGTLFYNSQIGLHWCYILRIDLAYHWYASTLANVRFWSQQLCMLSLLTVCSHITSCTCMLLMIGCSNETLFNHMKDVSMTNKTTKALFNKTTTSFLIWSLEYILLLW